MTAEEYIKKLSLEEKAALLQGNSSWTTRPIPRLLLPGIWLADGPHGLRKQAGSADHLGINESVAATCFPTAATMANSWDPQLGEELGKALGEEAQAQGVQVVLGPGLNIKRSPLCGRNFEYFSEDPFLAGKLAAGYIRGIQSQGVAACPKHFAANSQERQRMCIDSVVDERTLREIYLTSFETAVKEGQPKAIMSSYNPVNGVYANENNHLLKDILRTEWGFDGFVVSDWGACNDPAAGIAAGSALNMPNPGFDSAAAVCQAVRDGRISESDLDDRLRELLPIILTTTETSRGGEFFTEEHHALARTCAAESIVLLENDGILPLNSGASIAVIGDFAQTPRYQGAGSSLVNPTMVDDLLTELGKAYPNVTFAQGYRRGAGEPDRALIRQAAQIAKAAEVVLLCVGLDELSECEGMDRTHMDLPEAQQALIKAVSRANENVVLVLSGGAPFVMPPQGTYRAAIHGYLSGQAGAGAMADALLGTVNPGGKLAETWPIRLEDTPCHRYYPGEHRTAEYREGLYVGYRYYDTAGVAVRYPFGYGLSYTTFAYSDLQTDGKNVAFTLTNTGDRDGAEVAQVYVTCRTGKAIHPKKELKGFQKVFLKAGESRRITIRLDDKAFRYFNTSTGRWEMETAHYLISVAASVDDVRLTATVRIIGTEAAAPVVSLPSYVTGNVRNVSDEEFAALLGHDLPEADWSGDIGINDPICRFRDARSAPARWLYRFLSRKAEKQTGKPDMTYHFILNMPIRAMAQMTGGKISRAMTEDIVYLVNGHFFRGLGRLVKGYFRARKADKQYEKELQYGPRDR
ncbi:MAG: glycoside hydrolase family 3 C-terminal domain-containing protein [Oscillospiraceae bacterium]|nr:glycoside hydrolase family 3 C-terminal domain-containing protein [Oscillospiraceae bacterium]